MNQLQMKLMINQLSCLNKNQIPLNLKEYLIEVLKEILPYIPILIDTIKVKTIYRATLNRNVNEGSNSRIKSIDLLSYPKPEIVNKFGRCNFPKEPIFYCSLYELINFSELKPSEGDIVSLSTWEVIDEELQIWPIFPKELFLESYRFQDNLGHRKILENNLFGRPQYEQDQILLLLNFLASVFEKVVDRRDDSNYLLSAILAKLMFEKEKMDAIFYSSVQANFPYSNLAIKRELIDSGKIRIVNVKELVLARSNNEIGGFISYLTGECNNPNEINNADSWKNQTPPISKASWSDFMEKYCICPF
jgi:hypothetical protein